MNEANDNWKHRAKGMKCVTCMHWVSKDGTALGRCRKHAPVVGEGWPATFAMDWCGDHKLSSEGIDKLGPQEADRAE